MSNWESNVLEINGLHLHYTRTGGNKPPVVLVHGFSEAGVVWAALAEELEGEYDVIMPDARGHGESDPAETGLGGGDLASDLHGIISALGLVKPAVIGHSMGGMTTFALAGLYPDDAGAFVVEDGMPFEMRRATSENSDSGGGLRAYFNMIKGKNHEELMAWRRVQSPNWGETDVRTFADAKVLLNPQTLAPFMNRDAAPSTPREAPTPLDWPTLLHQIHCPGLLIIGDTSIGAMVSAQDAAALQEQVPTLRVAQIADATHDIRRDQSAAFLEIITPFLAEWAAAR